MSLKKDKEKVLDEQFDENALRRFLALKAPAGVNEDFHILERAYRGLQAQDFDRFLALFCAENRQLDSTNKEGKTLAEVIASHRQAAPYIAVLQKRSA
ncbi:MAG: PA4642 family protein [Pseudomonadales bacterium]|nr:PA4642 family protein [Pseudomonadales bacterium]